MFTLDTPYHIHYNIFKIRWDTTTIKELLNGVSFHIIMKARLNGGDKFSSEKINDDLRIETCVFKIMMMSERV